MRHFSRRLQLMFRIRDCRVDCRCLRDIRCQLNLTTRGLCQSLTTTKHSATKCKCLSTTQNVSSVITAPRTRASRRYIFETCNIVSLVLTTEHLASKNTARNDENVFRLDICSQRCFKYVSRVCSFAASV